MPKKPPKPLKTMADRVRDSVEILQNLKNVGIGDTDLGYIDTKKILDDWIRSGETWQGKVDFPRHGRYLEMILPERQDRKCTTVLRATELLKQEWKKKDTE
jgi:hypothetical protein